MTPKAAVALAVTLSVFAVKPAVAQQDPSRSAASAAADGGVPLEYLNVDDVPGVDTSRLDKAQRLRAYNLIRSERCTCGCDMTLLRCRTEDQTCGTSAPLAQGIADAILAGKTDDEIKAKLEPAPTRLVEEMKHEFSLRGAPSRGPHDAKVTVVEFADYQCAVCALSQTWLPKVLEIYPEDVRLVFKHFPVRDQQLSAAAAEAAMAAHAQGKFWELHDRMFSNVASLGQAQILSWARAIGLDMERFQGSLQKNEFLGAVLAEAQEARTAGAPGVPAFYINGQRLLETPSYEALRDAIEAALAVPDPRALAQLRTAPRRKN